MNIFQVLEINPSSSEMNIFQVLEINPMWLFEF